MLLSFLCLFLSVVLTWVNRIQISLLGRGISEMGTREPVGLLLLDYDCIDSRGAQQARVSNDQRHKLVSLDSLLCLLTAGLCLSLFRCLGL